MSRFRYHYLNRGDSKVYSVPREKEDAYFRVIEQLTGLDRAIATCILQDNARGFIEHPQVRFFYLDSEIVPLADPTARQ